MITITVSQELAEVLYSALWTQKRVVEKDEFGFGVNAELLSNIEKLIDIVDEVKNKEE